MELGKDSIFDKKSIIIFTFVSSQYNHKKYQLFIITSFC